MDNTINKTDYENIVHLVKARKETGEGFSVSTIQRRLRAGRSYSEKIMKKLERDGYVSEFDGTKPREILI
ncbi:hypothetical protein AQ616_18800 [Oceanobacillus sp. E9]|uniref:DNA translocase FtsK n=1 Tax=Oceanobacillus sp. E9 TaxID=1742575 RepID=UPI00084E9BAF|nr:DNA translocase FtsK [Oceanobacillus sp. E9]OEH52955.1 hypothetical protein AQ616_18800 [Oceanobacillus sp. E9]